MGTIIGTIRRLAIAALYIFVTAGVFSQADRIEPESGTTPEIIRRPQSGEAPRYPRDVVIGELGRGMAPQGAYDYARFILGALLRDNRDSAYLASLGSALVEELAESIGLIAPLKYRVGGGREEIDGGVSFLFRFIGRERGIAGELYLRLKEEENVWRFEDIIIEESRDIPERGNSYEYDFSPYERFF